MDIPKLISNAKDEVRIHLGPNIQFDLNGGYKQSIEQYIRQYVAAILVNFTDWIGKTLPWVRSPEARFALQDNLRCEQQDDHIGLLEAFATLCNARPTDKDYLHVIGAVNRVRDLLRDTNLAGLTGTTVLTILENTSEVFIPNLKQAGRILGCTDFRYTDVHGVADAEHSGALIKALTHEFSAGYGSDADLWVEQAVDESVTLIKRIFTLPSRL